MSYVKLSIINIDAFDIGFCPLLLKIDRFK